MLSVNHGRAVIKRGNRYFAVDLRQPTISEQYAAVSASGIRRNAWQRVDNASGGARRARVVVNALGRAAPRRQPRFGA